MPSKLYNFSKRMAVSLLYKLPAFPTNMHGRWVRIHPRARFSITARTFYKGEQHVRTWLLGMMKPGQVFFDVGAHHGWVSIWTLPLVGAEGKVYSFEPSPANLSILAWHRAHNSFPQWEIIPGAVSDSDAQQVEFLLIDHGDSPMNSLITKAVGTPLMSGRDLEKVSVRTITLDTFCGEANVTPDVVKIDVEGAELMVLRGAAKLLRESRPTLILAVHPYWLPAGQSTRQLFELLAQYGYSMYDSHNRPVDHLQEGEYLCLNAMSGSAVLEEHLRVGNLA